MFWAAVIGALKKIPWQLWMAAGVFLSFWLYGNWQYRQGAQSVQVEWDAAKERGKKVIAELEVRANKVNEKIVEKVVTKTEVIRGKTEYIIKKVPVYIPADTPDLPAGFRVLHDAAATSQLPGQTPTSGNPVPVKDVAVTVTENYQTCHLWKVQLDAWENWYQEQSRSWLLEQHK